MITTPAVAAAPRYIIKYPASIDNYANTDNLSIIFDEELIKDQQDDIINNNSVINDVEYFNGGQLQFNHLVLQNHNNIPVLTTSCSSTTYPHHQNDPHVPAVMPTTMVCEEEDDCCCLSSLMPPPSKRCMNNLPASSSSSPAAAAAGSCSIFMDHPTSLNLYDLSGNSDLPAAIESSSSSAGILGGNLFLGEEELVDDFNASACIAHPTSLPTPPLNYNSNQLQLLALSNEISQHLVNGTPLTTEITSLEAETTAYSSRSVATKLTLTTQERRQKIHRYMNKRNHRNFTKKIKYACRKTLADSRPRVRGRFAKNDHEFGETTINININNTSSTTCNYSNNQEEEDTEDEYVKSAFHVINIVKEEEEGEEEMNLESSSSDIFAHISGVNSFKCNYPIIQSWI